MEGIKAIWRQNCHALPGDKEPFGFRDGISHPAIEGSGIPGTNPKEQPLRAGEFVLGYPDELGGIQKTEPELLGRNGTYVVFRKLHQRVADFRRYLDANSKDQQEEELLAAKMMGRWRSGAPLSLCPFHDGLVQLCKAMKRNFTRGLPKAWGNANKSGLVNEYLISETRSLVRGLAKT